jgi:hypothetical protein
MIAGVIQSNYIPWKGYFDIMHDVDVFVFYDDVQFTKNDWRNRNLIKTPAGRQWLSIPVGKAQDRLIHEVAIPDTPWACQHWAQLQAHYAAAPYFATYAPMLEEVYLARAWTNLSELNQHLICRIARDCLGITTEVRDSREFGAVGHKQERLIDLLAKVGADAYVSGPTARDYIDEARFDRAGIEIMWKDYGGYPEYPQFHPPFTHQVTILDLLFHQGPSAPDHIWGWRDAPLVTAAVAGVAVS